MTRIVLLLFTLSGTSGLVYEILWIRQLSHLLGGTSYAISTVLAAFMGGLALGSRFYGRRADATARPLRLYAWLEFGIAAFALCVYAVLAVATPAYVWLAQHLPAGSLGVLRVVVAILLLVPPTFFMGGTLPVLSRFVVRQREQLGRGLGLLYAVNTFGAVIGCWMAGFVLVSSLGVAGSMAVALVLNIGVGIAAFAIDRHVAGAAAMPVAAAAAARATATAASSPGAASGFSLRLLVTIFALSGFAALGCELYWTKGLQHFLGNSTYAFTTMLTTFLLGLAAGGWAGGRLVDRVAAPARLLGWVQIAAGATVLLSVLLIWDWLPRLADSRWFSDPGLGWGAYILRRFAAAAAIMLPPTLLLGMTFPIVSRIGIVNLQRVGDSVGFLYFSNTLGAIAGSLVAGYMLLPWIGAKAGLMATGALSALLGLAAHMGLKRRRSVEPWAALLAVALLVGVTPVLRGAGRTLLSDTQVEGDRVLFQREDRAGETRVYRKVATGDLHMSVDGHHIGGTEPGILRKEKILAHLPMLLAPQATSSLCVGLGSGITLGTFGLYAEMQDLTCVEIVPGVVDGARQFGEHNEKVLDDPRLNLHVGDGVQFLLTTTKRFDIISSDSKLNPEYSGNAPLLSTDYYELCRDRLTPAGVMVQWLAVHTPNPEMEVITRSFVDVFPHAALYWYDPQSVLMAGSNAPIGLDIDAARRFIARDGKLSQDLQRLVLDDPYIAASLFVADRDQMLAQVPPGPRNSWARPRLEFSIGREFRRRPFAYHEDQNLKWLQRLRDPSGQRLRGDVDRERLQRFYASGAKLLDAFASGGGTSRLEPGLEHLQAGAALNPDDRRLPDYIKSIEIVASTLEGAHAEGLVQKPEDWVRLGLSRLDAGKPAESLPFFQRALEQMPDDANIQYNILKAKLDLQRWDEVGPAVAKFKDAFPRDPRGYSLAGMMHATRGELEPARAEFARAIELDPDDPGIIVNRNNLATALARLERYAEAGDEFARVSEVDPTYQKAAFFAAASYSMAGRTKEAARWMQVCLERGVATRQEFLDGEFFDKLKASEHWLVE